MQLQDIPLSQLRVCPNNPRKVGGASVEELAASIKAHRLIHNLTVRKNGKGYEVVAGARRLRALQQLDAAGELPAPLDQGIPCLVVDADTAPQVGLAENVLREAMHPADEFVAFRDLFEKHGMTIGEISERFGKPEKYVEQRMRLGNVAPELLDVYRAGDATLEQMMALAVVDDHKAQLEAWKAGEDMSYLRQPSYLRRFLVELDVSLDSPVGKFVGIEAYEAAGGEPRRDLFSELVTLPDSKLVDRLARERLEDEAAKQRKKGWGWVEAMPEFTHAERSKYRQSESKTPGDKLGAIVTIGSGGKLEVLRGLLKPGQRAPAGAGEKKQAAKKKVADTRATREYLLGIRTGVLRAALRGEPHRALAFLAAALAGSFFELDSVAADMFGAETGNWISPAQRAAIAVADPTGDAEREAWEKRLSDGAKKAGGVLEWLNAQDESVSFDLLAFIAASFIDSDNTYGASGEEDVFAFAKAVGVDLGAAWSVTPEWLAKQPKDYILEAVTDAAGKEAADALAKGKAKDLAAGAYEILVDKAWIPEQLRAPAPKPPKPAKKAGKKAKR